MGGGGGDNTAAIQQQAEESRKSGLRDQINQLFGVGTAQPQNFTNEENTLSNSLNSFYGDQQKQAYDQAERQMRFGAANTGNIGSTTYADEAAKLNTDNAMGATKINDAVQRAINGLRTSRENTRLNSINLVNSGSGPDAVASAATGLQNSMNQAQAGQKEDLTSNLFSNLAFTQNASNQAAQNAQLAQLLGVKGTTGSLYPTAPSGGTIVRTN